MIMQYCGVCGNLIDACVCFDDTYPDDDSFCVTCGAELTDVGTCLNDHDGDEEPTDPPKSDPWAMVERWSVWSSYVHGLCEDTDPNGRWMQANDVREACAEVERQHAEDRRRWVETLRDQHVRHAEEVATLKAECEAALAAAGRSHAQAVAKLTAERDAARAQLAADADTIQAVRELYRYDLDAMALALLRMSADLRDARRQP